MAGRAVQILTAIVYAWSPMKPEKEWALMREAIPKLWKRVPNDSELIVTLAVHGAEWALEKKEGKP
jgi:hypothetical protein